MECWNTGKMGRHFWNPFRFKKNQTGSNWCSKMTTQESTTTLHKIKRFISILSFSELLWPPVIIFLTVASFYTVISGNPDSLLVYTFALLCPGMAFVRLLDINNYLIDCTLDAIKQYPTDNLDKIKS